MVRTNWLKSTDFRVVLAWLKKWYRRWLLLTSVLREFDITGTTLSLARDLEPLGQTCRSMLQFVRLIFWLYDS